MERSISDEERDIKENIRRAVRAPDKKGSFRRETLNRMIALSHSPHPPIRMLAAGNIQLFLNDFPDLEEAAINAVYDLCEDQSPKVRMEGYAAITQVSKASGKWIKRNADVLVQLLQSDEPDEVVVVKKALIEHMDMDPKVTLSVLCDQILPADESASDEEQLIRDRLRSLVLTFLIGEAKRSILRHAMPGSDAEAIIIEELKEAIPLFEYKEIQSVVKDLLISLDGYNSRLHGIPLLNAIVKKASHNLRRDLQNKNVSLDTTRPLLELCKELIAKNHVAKSLNLLQFYCSSLTSRLTLQQLSPSVRCWIVCNMADLFEISQDHDVTREDSNILATLQKQIVEACPFLLQVLWDAGLDRVDVLRACVILLKLCLERKKEPGALLPANLPNALGTMTSKIEEMAPAQRSTEVVELIRSLYPLTSNNALRSSDRDGGISAAENAEDTRHQSGAKQLGSLHYRGTSNMGIGPSQYTSSARPERMSPSALSFRGAATHGKHAIRVEDGTRPSKRRKNEEMEQSPSTSSLLSRMSSSVTTSLASSNSRDITSFDLPQEGPPPGGWSIKGAATAGSFDKGPRAVTHKPVYSLLDRLDDGNMPSAGGVTDFADRRRKKGKFSRM